MPIDEKEIETRFTYHSPTVDQIPKYVVLRDRGRELAELFGELVPESREQSLAFTHLEQAIMWANAGIARRS